MSIWDDIGSFISNTAGDIFGSGAKPTTSAPAVQPKPIPTVQQNQPKPVIQQTSPQLQQNQQQQGAAFLTNSNLSCNTGFWC